MDGLLGSGLMDGLLGSGLMGELIGAGLSGGLILKLKGEWKFMISSVCPGSKCKKCKGKKASIGVCTVTVIIAMITIIPVVEFVMGKRANNFKSFLIIRKTIII
jgi:hypothetical protein